MAIATKSTRTATPCSQSAMRAESVSAPDCVRLALSGARTTRAVGSASGVPWIVRRYTALISSATAEAATPSGTRTSAVSVRHDVRFVVHAGDSS